MERRRDTYAFIGAILLLAGAVLLNIRCIAIALKDNSIENFRSYSYAAESDFPSSLIPYDEHPYNARLTIEDTRHYGPTDDEEWLTPFPKGGGYVRLGPDRRLFRVTMFHQLYCLNVIRKAIVDASWINDEDRDLTTFCFNYIHQLSLCAASTRLEPVKQLTSGIGVNGLGMEHTCRDWSLVYTSVEQHVK
ncbi:hypothetical protein CERSUDRAFT_93608 [Gelatoporia subvermispora B]|uniref:Uncharacterized protein n=1 Tax=Ceriporiopsis subvermispora (strain B) TaxID=914234 RepID=M2QM20_CERS8|nr:hypothetical protein CERSUDRAFT_93608 [Gelatoporia subvermispora B]